MRARCEQKGHEMAAFAGNHNRHVGKNTTFTATELLLLSHPVRISSSPSSPPSGNAQQQLETLSRALPWVNKELNQQQMQAVMQVLKAEYAPLPYIIFGPPGTGKSTILVFGMLIRAITGGKTQTLIISAQNAATETLAKGISGMVGSEANVLGIIKRQLGHRSAIRLQC